MRRFPIAARDLVTLMCHVGPVEYIPGVRSDLLVLTRYPDTLWLGTTIPWRAALARLRAAGVIHASPLGYLLPYIELCAGDYDYVRMGNCLFPYPPLRSITDGTSNTLFFGDGSVRIVQPGPSPGSSNGSSISDGTSNTILVGEQTPNTGGISTGFGDGSVRTVTPGQRTGGVTVGFGDGSVRTVTPGLGSQSGGSSITDGTSNTILIGEEDPGPPGTGSDTTVIVGGDGGVNHGPPRDIHRHRRRHVRVHGCA